VLSAGILIGILTYSGFFPFTMGGPTPPAALLVAEVVAAAADAVEDPTKKVPTALLVISLVSLLVGALLVLFGRTKTAGYAQQLPYPVLCGFLGAIGLLLMRNAFQILLSLKLKWVFVPKEFDDVGDLNPANVVASLGLGISVAAMLLFGIPRLNALVTKRGFKSTAVLPVCFVLPVIAFYAIAGGSGLDFGATGVLRTAHPSWLFKDLKSEPFWTLWVELYNPTNWELGAVASVLPNIFIASVLIVLAGMINMAGIEANAPQEKSLDLDTEFVQLGRACLFTGVLGGHPGHHVAAFTMPMKKDGGTTRVAPWTASALWLMIFLTGAPISSFVPRFFMGGCFLQVGFGLARLFLWDNRKSMDMSSKIVAWVMVLVALFLDLNYAALVGFMLASLNYIRLSTDVDVVQSVTRLDMRRSPKMRSMDDIKILNTNGHKVMMMELHGYLFWGTVDKIAAAFAEVIDGSDDDPEVIYVNIDDVSGVEVSVVGAFRKLHRTAGNVGIKIVICGLPDASVIGAQLDTLLRALPFTSPKSLIELLEESEDDLIKKFTPEVPKPSPIQNRTSADIELQERRTPGKQRMLALYTKSANCVYGMRWEAVDGVFHMNQSFIQQDRARSLVATAFSDKKPVKSFVHGSSEFQPKYSAQSESIETISAVTEEASVESLDASVMCQAFQQQKTLVWRDVVDAVLPRKALAQEFGIKQIFFVPTADGVYEMGSLEPDHTSLKAVSEITSPSFLDGLTSKSLVEQQNGSIANGVAVSVDLTNITPDQQPEKIVQVAAPAHIGWSFDNLRAHFTWNLLLCMETVGKVEELTEGQSLFAAETSGQIATDMFVVTDGVFGTYTELQKNMQFKSGIGSLLGATDVLLKRPRSNQIVCLSATARVVSLDSKAVRKLKTCDSPFVDLDSSMEFFEYVEQQMALREVTVTSTVI
jgi:SulP family sulfate permease